MNTPQPVPAEPGKSLWGKVISFVAEEETPAQRPTLQKQATTAANTAANVAATIVSGHDPEMLATLQKVITNRKTPYTALIEASDKMRAIIPDDVTRLKAAFAMISADGQRTLDSVTQALDVHAQDLSGELIRFKQASEGAVKAKVGTLRSTVSTLTASNETRAQQITSLSQQIENLNTQIQNQQQSIATDSAKISELSMQATNAEAEIAATTTKFAEAVEYLRNDLTNKKSQLASALA